MENLIINISIDQIYTEKNDRTVFNEETIQELSDSIRTYGILQNLTVRKNGKPNFYQLVAGERRLRAAKIAGLTEVPCKVLELTDDEYREVMLIENVQREDIHEMDQAEAFLRLMEIHNDPAAITLKVGKTVKYVKERLALNNLTTKAKELFRSNTMQLGHALILCLFKKDHQNQAIDRVMEGDKAFQYFNHPQDLRDWMNENILCSLSEAIFDLDDATLVKKAGACTSCTKQTGCNSELFATVTDEAKCMDQKCFLHKTEIFVAIQNKKMLKEFNLKKDDCPILSNSSWASDGELSSTKWRAAKKADECATVTLGFLERYNQAPVAIMVCTNKSCKTHFKQEAEEVKASMIPENESPSETLKRRLASRRVKEKVKDIHEARVNFMNEIAETKQQTHNEFELGYLIRIMAGRASMNSREIAVQMGFDVDTESSYYFDWIDEFITFLEKKGKATMVTYLRKLILRENLRAEDRSISDRDSNEDNLLLHGKSFNIDFKPFLKEVVEGRKETYKEQDAEVRTLAKKEKDRLKAIYELIESAEEEYPLLHQVVKAKDKKSLLTEQKVEDLSKLTFRLGLKRKKDGDIPYYVETITHGLKDLLQQIKSNKKGAA